MKQPSNFIASEHAGSRQDTAILLVGTAREFDIDQHDIVLAAGGFKISDALLDVLYAEGTATPPKTSGNRAAKNASSKGN